MQEHAPAQLVDVAAAGQLAVEELARFEDEHMIIPGLLVVTTSYVDSSFTADGRIALEADPRLNSIERARLLDRYDKAVKRSAWC